MATILMCEDDADVTTLLRVLLAPTGHSVDCVATVSEALAALDGVEYDIVLTDLGLPDGSGTIVCESARLAGARVIVMTANPVAAQLPEVRIAAEAVVSKPFDFDQLVALLDRN